MIASSEYLARAHSSRNIFSCATVTFDQYLLLVDFKVSSNEGLAFEIILLARFFQELRFPLAAFS
jgi:hypothetical protein